MLISDTKFSLAQDLPACLQVQGSKFKVFWAIQNQISVNQLNPCHPCSIKKEGKVHLSQYSVLNTNFSCLLVPVSCLLILDSHISILNTI